MTTNSRVHWWTSLALLGLSGMMAFVFFGPRHSLTTVRRLPEDRNVLRVAFTQKLLPDPHRRNFPLPQYNEFILSLWEPLVQCDPATSRPQPAAAESWEWSSDRRTLTLKLRPDAHWSNGDRVTAQDFVRAWHRLLEEHGTGAWVLAPLKNARAYLQGRVKDVGSVGVRAQDDLTLVVDLDNPRSTLVVELADPLLVPLHRSTDEVIKAKSYYDTPTALITNGPFCLEKASEDRFRLEVNKYYHSRDSVRLAGVDFIRADGQYVAALLVEAGVADLFVPLPYGPVRERVTERPVNLESELVLGVTAVDFNTLRGPLRDIRVRQALALALDRMGPIQKYDPGHMVPAWSWVPTMPGRTGLVLLKEDAAEARRLLAAAGFPGGKGFPVLRMALPRWMESDPFPSAFCEHWFYELGVRTYLAYEARPKWEARLLAGDFDMSYGTLVATVPDAGDLLSGFLQPLEYTGNKWDNSEVKALLNEANILPGPPRLAVLEKAERMIMAAVPSLPVMFAREQTLCGAEVRGWYPDSLARQNLRRMWLENPAAPGSAAPRS